MKLVVDTNVMISALGWNGPEYTLMKRVFERKAKLYFSADILTEFHKVAQRPKLGFMQDEIEEFIVALIEIGTLVVPEIKLYVIKACPSDNIFLECAQEAKADLLVSGDAHLLRLKEFEGTNIVRAREALKYTPD